MRNQPISPKSTSICSRGPAIRLGVEELVAEKCNDVESKEDAKVAKANTSQCLRRELSKDKVDGLVGEGGNGVP